MGHAEVKSDINYAVWNSARIKVKGEKKFLSLLHASSFLLLLPAWVSKTPTQKISGKENPFDLRKGLEKLFKICTTDCWKDAKSLLYSCNSGSFSCLLCCKDSVGMWMPPSLQPYFSHNLTFFPRGDKLWTLIFKMGAGEVWPWNMLRV